MSTAMVYPIDVLKYSPESHIDMAIRAILLVWESSSLLTYHEYGHRNYQINLC